MRMLSLAEETVRFAVHAAGPDPTVRVRACPPVITAILFEPPLPEDTTARLVVDPGPETPSVRSGSLTTPAGPASCPVADILRAGAWTEPRSRCGAAIAEALAEAGAAGRKFLDQSRYEVLHLRFAGRVPDGTTAVVRGFALRETPSATT